MADGVYTLSFLSASQLLSLLEVMMNEDMNWMLYMGRGVTMDNFVATPSGDVALLDLGDLMLVDRDFLDEDYHEKDEEECDLNCLLTFHDELIDSKTTTPCYKLRPKAELMFALACRNILSDMFVDRELRKGSDQRGLLHTITNEDESSEMNALLRECVDETERGGRNEAVMNLVELLRADFDDGDEDGEDERNSLGDYDEGGVPHEIETGKGDLRDYEGMENAEDDLLTRHDEDEGVEDDEDEDDDDENDDENDDEEGENVNPKQMLLPETNIKIE